MTKTKVLGENDPIVFWLLKSAINTLILGIRIIKNVNCRKIFKYFSVFSNLLHCNNYRVVLSSNTLYFNF